MIAIKKGASQFGGLKELWIGRIEFARKGYGGLLSDSSPPRRLVESQSVSESAICAVRRAGDEWLKVLTRDELELRERFVLNWIMPVKLKESPPQMELEVKHQNGTTHLVDFAGGLQLHYEHPHGRLYLGDSIEWLKGLPGGSIDLVFADPPYNIKKADWDDFESHEHYVAWSCEWLKEASRVLKKTGTLYVCGFSEVLADVKVAAMPFFKGCRWIVWHYKNKANLGGDWGRSH